MGTFKVTESDISGRSRGMAFHRAIIFSDISSKFTEQGGAGSYFVTAITPEDVNYELAKDTK